MCCDENIRQKLHSSEKLTFQTRAVSGMCLNLQAGKTSPPYEYDISLNICLRSFPLHVFWLPFFFQPAYATGNREWICCLSTYCLHTGCCDRIISDTDRSGNTDTNPVSMFAPFLFLPVGAFIALRERFSRRRRKRVSTTLRTRSVTTRHTRHYHPLCATDVPSLSFKMPE